MIAPAALITVSRGEPREIELHLEEDPGSPAPTLTFTLKRARDHPDVIYRSDVEHESGDPQTYRWFLSHEMTDRECRTYWWDAWRLDIHQHMAIGPIRIDPVVRLP